MTPRIELVPRWARVLIVAAATRAAPGRGSRAGSTQPRQPTSCLAWYSVDAFLRDGNISAITMDLWEP